MMSDPANAEQEALRRALRVVGYLHAEFSVEVRAGSGGSAAHDADVVIVRNDLTKTERRYRRESGQSLHGRFERDLTAGALN